MWRGFPGDIAPRNLVLRQAVKYNVLKITGFRKAIIYWNIETSDIAWASCLPAEQQATDGANYQAPEVYSENPEKEAFDPVVADTWSYGAVIYFMGSKGKYPYKPEQQVEDLEKEIQANVKKVPKVLSKKGKQLLGSLLCTNTNKRIPFGLVESSPWFKAAKQVNWRNQDTGYLNKPYSFVG